METRGVPFVFGGVKNVNDCKTSAEVIKKAGLDWSVRKAEIFAKILNTQSVCPGGIYDGANAYNPVDNMFATYRDDTGAPLGIVKGRYEPVQNIDAFKFFDDAIGKDEAIWQTAGALDGGSRVFVSAKLPNTITINGDPVDNYLVFLTSHDGSTGVKIMLTPVRIFCQNCLNAAIRNADSYISYRHTRSVHKNIDIAHEILGICNDKIKNLQLMYDLLGKKEMSDAAAQEAFCDLILTEAEINALKDTGHTKFEIVNRNYRAINDSGISMKKVNTISGINDYYYNGIAQNEIVGTAWGVYNAVTGYYSNVDNVSGQKRFDSLLFGDKATKIKSFSDYLLEV